MKYKVFSAILSDGRHVEIKAPQSRVTEKTAAIYAGHWCKMQYSIQNVEVKQVIGIK